MRLKKLNLAPTLALASALLLSSCSSVPTVESEPEATSGPHSSNCQAILQKSRETYRVLHEIGGYLYLPDLDQMRVGLTENGFESIEAYRESLIAYKDSISVNLEIEQYPRANFMERLDSLLELDLWLHENGKTGEDLGFTADRLQGDFESLANYCNGIESTNIQIDGTF